MYSYSRLNQSGNQNVLMYQIEQKWETKCTQVSDWIKVENKMYSYSRLNKSGKQNVLMYQIEQKWDILNQK